MTAAAAETHAAHGQSRNARRRFHSLWLHQDAVLRPFTSNFPTPYLSSGASRHRHLLLYRIRATLTDTPSLPLLFLRGERHFHGCFTCSRHAGCHFAARECRLLHNSRGPPLIGCLPYVSVTSGFQWGHLDTSPGASLRSFSVDPGSTLPIPTPHLKSTILASHLNLGQAARQCGPGRGMNPGPLPLHEYIYYYSILSSHLCRFHRFPNMVRSQYFQSAVEHGITAIVLLRRSLDPPSVASMPESPYTGSVRCFAN